MLFGNKIYFQKASGTHIIKRNHMWLQHIWLDQLTTHLILFCTSDSRTTHPTTYDISYSASNSGLCVFNVTVLQNGIWSNQQHAISPWHSWTKCFVKIRTVSLFWIVIGRSQIATAESQINQPAEQGVNLLCHLRQNYSQAARAECNRKWKLLYRQLSLPTICQGCNECELKMWY